MKPMWSWRGANQSPVFILKHSDDAVTHDNLKIERVSTVHGRLRKSHARRSACRWHLGKHQKKMSCAIELWNISTGLNPVLVKCKRSWARSSCTGCVTHALHADINQIPDGIFNRLFGIDLWTRLKLIYVDPSGLFCSFIGDRRSSIVTISAKVQFWMNLESRSVVRIPWWVESKDQ